MLSVSFLQETKEAGYRKDLIVVVDETGLERTAIAFFGETVEFDEISNVKLVSGGDVTLEFPFSHWK